MHKLLDGMTCTQLKKAILFDTQLDYADSDYQPVPQACTVTVVVIGRQALHQTVIAVPGRMSEEGV